MSEDRLAEGLVTRIELADLARLFDEFQNASDPASETTAQAKAEFNRRVKQFYDERVTRRYRSVSESVFSAKVRRWCREFLRQGGA